MPGVEIGLVLVDLHRDCDGGDEEVLDLERPADRAHRVGRIDEGVVDLAQEAPGELALDEVVDVRESGSDLEGADPMPSFAVAGEEFPFDSLARHEGGEPDSASLEEEGGVAVVLWDVCEEGVPPVEFPEDPALIAKAERAEEVIDHGSSVTPLTSMCYTILSL